MIGKKFGKLTVIGIAPSYMWKGKTSVSYRARFFCDCDCGSKEILVSAVHLRGGHRQHCKGCAYRARPQSTQRISDEQTLFNLCILRGLKHRKLDCSLDVDTFIRIATQNCHYCNAAPEQRNYVKAKTTQVHHKNLFANGIDRVDPNVGYHVGNCVPCCPRCNFAKRSMSEKEFSDWVARVYHHFVIKPN